MASTTSREGKVRGGMNGKFRNHVIIPLNRAMREHIINRPPFNFRVQFLFMEGRAHSHFLDYGTGVWKNDVKLYGEANSLLARGCVDGDLAVSLKASSGYSVDR
jgi:hypothetical protein